MPIENTQASARIGQHQTRLAKTALNPAMWSPARPRGLRIDTPFKVAVMLLVITNAARAHPAAPARVGRPLHGAMTGPGCNDPAPLTFAHALHETGEFLQNPVNEIDGVVRSDYGAIVHRCPPAQTAVEKGLVQLGDAAVKFGEGLVDPALPAAAQGVGALLKLAGDGIEGKPLDEAIIDDVLSVLPGFQTDTHPAFQLHPTPVRQRQGPTSIRIFESTERVIQKGVALDPAKMWHIRAEPDGILRYSDAAGDHHRAIQVNGDYYCVQAHTRDTLRVGGVALVLEGDHYILRDEPEEVEQQRVRCQRSPGAGCTRVAPRYSDALSGLLRAHQAHAVDEATARLRRIVPDPLHAGWHMRIKNGKHHSFLRVIGEDGHGFYFPVKTHEFGSCRRLTLHLPRRSSDESRGPALVDIVERSTAEGVKIITQDEQNLERGISAGASGPYEHGIKHAFRVKLNQFQRAALMRYQGAEEVALNRFMYEGDPVAYRQREFQGEIHSLRGALKNIPAYTGRAFRGAMLPTQVLEQLRVGDSLYIHTFIRANGDRDAALEPMAGREVPSGLEPILLNIHTPDAHPTGLYTLRHEGEVMIGNGRTFRVVDVRSRELVLEAAELSNQSPHLHPPVTLRLG